MGWRDYAKQIQDAGHIRHNGHESPSDAPNVPNVPTVPEALAQSRLREWHARLSKVDEFTSPAGWTLNQWLTLVDTSCWLYENYASRAVRDGWSALDLFGVRIDRPGEGGLADRLGDCRALVMGADAASWRSWGVAKIYLRGGGEGLVPQWETNR